MTADSTPPGGEDEPRLSWRDRELLSALRRLANARAQVQSMEAELEKQRGLTPPDPADVELVEAFEAELAKLRVKAGSRFGGGAARERIPDVEMQQRLVLERLGFESYRAFADAGRRAAPSVEPPDPHFVEFAHHELAAAEEAYEQVLAMPDDDTDQVSPTTSPERSRTIDLT